MKHLLMTFSLLVILQMTSLGQMQKFPKQNPNLTCMTSFLLANQNTQLLFWYCDYQLLLSRSIDGINWSDTVVLKQYSYLNNWPGDYYASMPYEITGMVLGSRIFIVIRDDYFSSLYSDDNGLTWSVPKSIPAGATSVDKYNSYNGSLCQTSFGKLIFFYSQTISGINYLRFITSSDAGVTWSAQQTFATGLLFSSVSSMGNNQLILVYKNKGLFSSISTDGGSTWNISNTLVVNDTGANTPKIVRDQSGMLWLFYQRILPASFAGITQQDILYKTSSDNGLTWGAENNFTRYKGFDGYVNVSSNGNNPLVSFSSDRRDSTNTVRNLWYGTAGITNDINTPTCIYKYAVSDSLPQPGKPFNISIYVDYNGSMPTIMLNRIISGTLQSSIKMYDDGTHGDTVANDKIFTCEVPGLAQGDGMLTKFVITDSQFSPFNYRGPDVTIPFNNSITAMQLNVNRFQIPVYNNGVLGEYAKSGIYQDGMYDGQVVLFSLGFMLSGITNGHLWSNVDFDAANIFDYVPGKIGTIPEDPKNILYVVKSTDPPFGQSWQDWKYAVSQGASFYDGNHDGIYNPVDLNGNGKWDINEDRPDFLGDMTIWCVYNDGLPTIQRWYHGVTPQGIEVQQTVFAQKDSADLNNVVFIRYRIINRGTSADVIDSVYLGLVDDIDIGDSGAHDLSGCDTLLNSVYTYHPLGSGDSKFGTDPPAEAITLLQGPLSYIPGITFTDVNGNGVYDPGTDIPIDTGYSYSGPLLGKTIYPGATNLKMTSANDYFKAADPRTLLEAQYTLLGRNKTNGTLFDPCTWGTGEVLGGINCSDVNPLYLFSGDPITQMGWIDNVPRDERNIINTGPFRLEKNKPVDIITANIVGRGSDPLNSVTVTRGYAANIIKYYNNNFPNSILTGVRDSPQVINSFNLFQNYPNPFNPSTRIKYFVRTSGLVSIKVYNILGKEVAVLVNEHKNPGEYELTFNSAKYNLASGVYFYKLTSGGFTSVKKMMLLK